MLKLAKKCFANLLLRVNHSKLFSSSMVIWGNEMFSLTFDRTIYLLFHKFGLMGLDDAKIYEKYIKKGMTVIDVGANIGIYTGLFSKLVGPQGKVIAIEPAIDNWLALKLAKDQNNWANVEIYNHALSESEGTMFVSYGILNSGNTILTTDKNHNLSHKISTLTLDQIIDDKPVDFIKIDVQGWEASVLKGAQRTLLNNRPLVVRLEILPFALKDAGSSAAEVFSILEKSGLKNESLGKTKKYPSSENSYFGGYDVIYKT